MSDSERKYVRVYYNDLIRDYPDVWSDNDQLATWLRLLATADPMWPTSPELPRTVRPKPLAALVAATLVEVVAAHRFRMKGMDAERSRRADAGRNAAAKRWHSDGIAHPLPTRAEMSKAEPSSSAPASDDPWDAPEQEALVWLAKHGCDIRPGNGYHQKLVVAVEQHGITAVIGMLDRLASAGMHQGDTKGFLFGAIDALNARTRPSLVELEKQDRAEDASQSTKRAVERTQAYLRELRGEA